MAQVLSMIGTHHRLPIAESLSIWGTCPENVGRLEVQVIGTWDMILEYADIPSPVIYDRVLCGGREARPHSTARIQTQKGKVIIRHTHENPYITVVKRVRNSRDIKGSRGKKKAYHQREQLSYRSTQMGKELMFAFSIRDRSELNFLLCCDFVYLLNFQDHYTDLLGRFEEGFWAKASKKKKKPHHVMIVLIVADHRTDVEGVFYMYRLLQRGLAAGLLHSLAPGTS